MGIGDGGCASIWPAGSERKRREKDKKMAILFIVTTRLRCPFSLMVLYGFLPVDNIIHIATIMSKER